jgi:hypothetical protein
LDWNAIEEAYKSILKQDTELTDVDIRISLKPAIEQKVAKIRLVSLKLLLTEIRRDLIGTTLCFKDGQIITVWSIEY